MIKSSISQLRNKTIHQHNPQHVGISEMYRNLPRNYIRELFTSTGACFTIHWHDRVSNRYSLPLSELITINLISESLLYKYLILPHKRVRQSLIPTLQVHTDRWAIADDVTRNNGCTSSIKNQHQIIKMVQKTLTQSPPSQHVLLGISSSRWFFGCNSYISIHMQLQHVLL